MRKGDVVKWQYRTGGSSPLWWMSPRRPDTPEVSREIVGTIIHGDQWDRFLAVRAVVDGEVRLFRVWRSQAELVREMGKPPSKVWGVEP